MTLDFLRGDMEQAYYRLISKIESNDNPRAKNPYSSASGRFQFIRSTWEGLGYDWADVFNDDLQWLAVEKFTAMNAEILRRSGCYLNFATLYGAHFLGASGFLRMMRASPTTPLKDVTSASQRQANKSILGGDKTVQDFTDWLEKKTGHKYNVNYDSELAPAKEKREIKVAPIWGLFAVVGAYIAAKVFGAF